MSDSLPPMTDETLTAIEARFANRSPGATFDVTVDGNTLRATADTENPHRLVTGISGLVATFTGGDIGPVTATFVDDEDGQDATFALNAANDIRRLIAEVKRLRTKAVGLIDSNGGAWAEAALTTRGLRAELASMTQFAESLRAERDRSVRSCGELGVELERSRSECAALAAKLDVIVAFVNEPTTPERAAGMATARRLVNDLMGIKSEPNQWEQMTNSALGLDQDGRGQDA